MDVVTTQVARRTGLDAAKVQGCCRLLHEGNTVPFIARYRKETTGALDEVQIRAVEEALEEVNALIARKKTILTAIEKQGKLTDELQRLIDECWDRQALEDLYLPFKQRRSTRADAARAAGLEPLALQILGRLPPAAPTRIACALRFAQATGSKPEAAVVGAASVGAGDAEAALAGARDIVADMLAVRPPTRGRVRELAMSRGRLQSKKARQVKRADESGQKRAGEDVQRFSDYFEHEEAVSSAASHRVLAMLRGEDRGALSLKIAAPGRMGEEIMARDFSRGVPTMFRQDFEAAVADGFERLLWPAVEREVLGTLKERADRASVLVFEQNLRSLLMAPPCRGRRVLGVDPGFAHGCKLACVDETGAVLWTGKVHPLGPPSHPVPPPFDLAQGRQGGNQVPDVDLAQGRQGGNQVPGAGTRGAAVDVLVSAQRRFGFTMAAVGDGTAHRETMAFLESIAWPAPVEVTAVREAGASVYSASSVAVAELPDLDVTLRGAVSIGRRFQDPLAELVKIEPKALGVGQYQHDVDQALLARGLDAVVEECVNRVGVEVNSASAELLARVAGIGPATAKGLVAHRTSHGPLSSRKDLLKVPGIGPARFLQAAGFLRISGGKEPLDATGIHPERYEHVRRALSVAGVRLDDILGKPAEVQRLAATLGAAPSPAAPSSAGPSPAAPSPAAPCPAAPSPAAPCPAREHGASGYQDEPKQIGDATWADILAELARPARDPRGERVAFQFGDASTIDGLSEGMILPGRVTNITDFGAFVDIGVHRDGLVHVSRLADRRVSSPFEVCRPGQVVKVKVIGVDRERKRISLSMRPSDLK